MKRLLLIYCILMVQSYGYTDINITGTRISATCQKIKRQAYTYYTWAEGCPAYNRSQALNFLRSRNITQATLPTCQQPSNLNPPLGETLSQPVPSGYTLKNEQITQTQTRYYQGYNTSSSNANVRPFVGGAIRTNTTITSGYCYGLSASISFTSDVYAGVITTESFTRTYRKVCTLPDTKFPTPAINQIEVLPHWTDKDTNLTQTCHELNGTVEDRRVSCVMEHRCVKETQTCPTERNEPISSYVSPRDGSFHEDIALSGTDFGLHYSSAEWNSTKVAHGWAVSSHAWLEGNRLHYGSGSVRVVDTSTHEGNLTVVLSGSSEMLFDAEGKLQNIRDLYTKEIKSTFGYDNMGRLVTLTNIYGEITTIERDSNGTVTAIVAPTGQRTLLSVDAKGDLVEVQYEDTSSYAFEYARHLMTVETEPNGNRFLHFFDDSGNVVKVIDAEQGEWNFSSASDSTQGSHTVTRASGDVVVYTNHFLENNATTLTSQKLLPTGDVVTYANALDDSQSSTTSCGMETVNIYRKNADGTLYRNPYTQRRELESSRVTTPSGLSKLTTFSTNYYTKNDGTLKRIDRLANTNGKTTLQRKNLRLHRDVSISALGKRSVLQYDAQMKNLLWTKSYGLFKTHYNYDAQGRVTQSRTGNRVTHYSYDSRGNLASITDPLGKTTTYSYDSRDRVVQTTYPDGSTESFAYDANSNLVTRTVPTPADHSFGYNGVNKRTSTTSPEQKQTTYTYDKQRRVIKVTKPSGKSIETNYVNGRVESIVTPEGTTNYAYACQSNVSSITTSTGSATDESFTFTYDGTLVTSISQSGILNQNISYTYNNDFNPASMTYSGSTENYTYNDDGEIVNIGNYTITRQKKNRVIKVSDGIYTHISKYNRYGELKKIKDNTIKIALKRNRVGQIVKKEEKIDYKEKEEKGSHHTKRKKHHKEHREHRKGAKDKKENTSKYRYSYDERGRLIKVRKNHKTVESYTYDSNGNRASAKVYGTTITASYTLDDNLVTYGQNSYLYDEDGYLKEKTTPQGTTTYTYGTRGELLSVTTPTSTGSVTVITYKHNALNQRVAKLVNGQVVEKYLWENLTTLLAIYDANDNLKQRFEYADQRMPISMTDANGTKYYLHYDQVGSLRAVSDTSHNIVKEISYDTFGNMLTDSNPSFTVPFGFAGGLYDTDTKLTRFGYRDYDAYTGKWTAKDPIGFSGGDSNLYGYVLGDPVDFVDPEGLKWWNPFSWWSKETSDETSDDALKKAYCSAAKSKKFGSCKKVHDAMKNICIYGTELGTANDDYYGFCKITLQTGQDWLHCDK